MVIPTLDTRIRLVGLRLVVVGYGPVTPFTHHAMIYGRSTLPRTLIYGLRCRSRYITPFATRVVRSPLVTFALPDVDVTLWQAWLIAVSGC